MCIISPDEWLDSLLFFSFLSLFPDNQSQEGPHEPISPLLEERYQYYLIWIFNSLFQSFWSGILKPITLYVVHAWARHNLMIWGTVKNCDFGLMEILIFLFDYYCWLICFYRVNQNIYVFFVLISHQAKIIVFDKLTIHGHKN